MSTPAARARATYSSIRRSLLRRRLQRIAGADHRLRLESRQIAPFLAALAARVAPDGAKGLPGAGVPGVDPRWIDALAKDLLANRGRSVIVAGERQPAVVHAAVCALNTSLGNTGRTVSYFETRDAALPSVSSLAALVSAMQGGAVQTLVVLGGNPAFDAPADLGFAAAMAKVPHSIALGHAVTLATQRYIGARDRDDGRHR